MAKNKNPNRVYDPTIGGWVDLEDRIQDIVSFRELNMSKEESLQNKLNDLKEEYTELSKLRKEYGTEMNKILDTVEKIGQKKFETESKYSQQYQRLLILENNLKVVKEKLQYTQKLGKEITNYLAEEKVKRLSNSKHNNIATLEKNLTAAEREANQSLKNIENMVKNIKAPVNKAPVKKTRNKRLSNISIADLQTPDWRKVFKNTSSSIAPTSSLGKVIHLKNTKGPDRIHGGKEYKTPVDILKEAGIKINNKGEPVIDGRFSASGLHKEFHNTAIEKEWSKQNAVVDKEIEKARKMVQNAVKANDPNLINIAKNKLYSVTANTSSSYGTAMHKVTEEISKLAKGEASIFTPEELKDISGTLNKFKKNPVKWLEDHGGFTSGNELAGLLSQKDGEYKALKDVPAVLKYMANNKKKGEEILAEEMVASVLVQTAKGRNAILDSTSDSIIRNKNGSLVYRDYKFRASGNHPFEQFMQGIVGATAVNSALKDMGIEDKIKEVQFDTMKPGTGKISRNSIDISGVNESDLMSMIDLAIDIQNKKIDAIDAVTLMPKNIQELFIKQYMGGGYFDNGASSAQKNGSAVKKKFISIGSENISKNQVENFLRGLGVTSNFKEGSIQKKLSSMKEEQISKIVGTISGTLGDSGNKIKDALKNKDFQSAEKLIKELLINSRLSSGLYKGETWSVYDKHSWNNSKENQQQIRKILNLKDKDPLPNFKDIKDPEIKKSLKQYLGSPVTVNKLIEELISENITKDRAKEISKILSSSADGLIREDAIQYYGDIRNKLLFSEFKNQEVKEMFVSDSDFLSEADKLSGRGAVNYEKLLNSLNDNIKNKISNILNNNSLTSEEKWKKIMSNKELSKEEKNQLRELEKQSYNQLINELSPATKKQFSHILSSKKSGKNKYKEIAALLDKETFVGEINKERSQIINSFKSGFVEDPVAAKEMMQKKAAAILSYNRDIDKNIENFYKGLIDSLDDNSKNKISDILNDNTLTSIEKWKKITNSNELSSEAKNQLRQRELKNSQIIDFDTSLLNEVYREDLAERKEFFEYVPEDGQYKMIDTFSKQLSDEQLKSISSIYDDVFHNAEYGGRSALSSSDAEFQARMAAHGGYDLAESSDQLENVTNRQVHGIMSGLIRSGVLKDLVQGLSSEDENIRNDSLAFLKSSGLEKLNVQKNFDDDVRETISGYIKNIYSLVNDSGDFTAVQKSKFNKEIGRILGIDLSSKYDNPSKLGWSAAINMLSQNGAYSTMESLSPSQKRHNKFSQVLNNAYKNAMSSDPKLLSGEAFINSALKILQDEFDYKNNSQWYDDVKNTYGNEAANLLYRTQRFNNELTDDNRADKIRELSANLDNYLSGSYAFSFFHNKKDKGNKSVVDIMKETGATPLSILSARDENQYHSIIRSGADLGRNTVNTNYNPNQYGILQQYYKDWIEKGIDSSSWVGQNNQHPNKINIVQSDPTEPINTYARVQFSENGKKYIYQVPKGTTIGSTFETGSGGVATVSEILNMAQSEIIRKLAKETGLDGIKIKALGFNEKSTSYQEKVENSESKISHAAHDDSGKISGSIDTIKAATINIYGDNVKVIKGGSSGGGGDGGSNKDDKESAKLARLEARENEKEFKSIMGQFTALSKEKMRISRESDLTPDWDSTKKNALTGNYIEVDAELSSVMSDLERYKNIVSSDTFQRGMDDYTKKIEAFKRSMNLQKGGAQNIWQTLGNSFKNMIYQFTQMGAAYAIIGKVRQSIQRIITDSQNLDKALTNIRIVTGQTSDETQQLMISYSQLGHELSATTTEVATSANEWLRQGYEVAEVNDLITASLHLSKLGMIESSQATEYLTSTLKGFKIQASDAMDIVDKLTAIDMNAAVSAGGIAQALQNFANIASMSGLDIDQSAAMASTIIDVSQKDPSSVGNAIKTMLSRYGNVKAGAYAGMDLGDESIDESINDIEKVLSKIGISIRKSNTEMREFDDVLAEISEKWSTLDSVSQNAIATAMAGVRQREAFVSLMNNMDKYENLLETSRNSQGTAEEKYLSYTEQLEAAQKRLAAEWEELAQSAELNKFLITITDVATFLVDKLPIILRYLTRMIALTQSYKIPSWLNNASQFLGIGKIDKNKFSLKSYYGKNFDEKVSKYYNNNDNKGGLFSSTTLQLKNFTEGLKQAIASLNNFAQANNTAAKYSAYSGGASYTGGSNSSILDNYVTYDYSVASTTPSNYGFTSGNYINTSSSWNPSAAQPASTSYIKATPIKGKAVGKAAAGKIAGTALGGVTGFMTAGTTKLNWVTGEEEEMSEEAAIVSKLNTGLATAIGSIWGPLVGMAAGMLADVLNKYLIGPLIDRENDMFREYVKQGQEKLEAINAIKESTKKIEKYSSKDLSYESYQGITDAVSELKSAMFENEQVTEQLLQLWKGQDIAGVIIRSTADIEELLDKYRSSPESREEIMREVNAGVSKAQYESMLQANAEQLKNFSSDLKDAYDFELIKENGSNNEFQDGIIDLMKAQGVNYVLTKRVHVLSSGDNNDYYNPSYNNFSELEYIAEAYGKALEQYLNEHPGDDLAEEKLANHDANYDKLLSVISQYSSLFEGFNKSIVEGSLYEANIGGQYLLEMSDAQLKQLTLKDEDAIYNAVVSSINANYGGLDGYNIYSSKGRSIVESYIKENEKLYNALSGFDFSLSEALVSDQTRILQNFASALGVSVEQLRGLEDSFGDLKLSQLLANSEDTLSDMETVEQLFLSMSEYSGITAENMASLIKLFPELLPYLSDSVELSKQLVGKYSILSELYAKQVLDEQLGSTELLNVYKNYLSSDTLTALNKSEYGDVTGVKDLFQLFNMSNEELQNLGFSVENIEEMKKVYSELFTYEMDDIYSKEQYTKYIDYLTQINQRQIDNLETQKEALSNINKQREYENKLVEAKIKLEEAQKEKKRVWREGVGWTYESDQQKIEDAKSVVEDLENQKTIDELNLEIAELESQNEELAKIQEEESFKNMENLFNGFVSGLSDTLGSDATYQQIVNAIVDGVEATVKVDGGGAYNQWISARSDLRDDIYSSYNKLCGTGGLRDQINTAYGKGDLETAKGLKSEYDTEYGIFKQNMDKYNTSYSNHGKEFKDSEKWNPDVVDHWKNNYSSDTQFTDLVTELGASENGIQIDGTWYYIDSNELTYSNGGRYYKYLKGDFFRNDGKIKTGVNVGDAVDSSSLQEYKKPRGWTKSQHTMQDMADNAGWKNTLIVGAYGDKEWAYVDANGRIHKLSVNPYKLGSESIPSDQNVVINEQGTEAIITPQGTITSLPAHTGIVPADITSNLWQLGELAPSILRSLGGPSNLLSGSVSNHSTMTDESFNVNTINMTVEADSSFDPQAFVNAIKTRISLTKNNKKY